MRLRTLICAFSLFATVILPNVGAAAPPPLPPQPKVHPAGVPADAVLVSPCVVGMGEHWANLKNLPLGPIYGVYNGKPVFTEIMVDQKAFAAGKSWDKMLAPLPGYKIDHVDIDFVPYGHAGYPIKHYDIHAYYVGHDTHGAFCPNGEAMPRAPQTR